MNRTSEAISRRQGAPSKNDSDSAKSQSMKAIRIHNSVNLVTRTKKLSSA
jgi:hypothetical protein